MRVSKRRVSLARYESSASVGMQGEIDGSYSIYTWPEQWPCLRRRRYRLASGTHPIVACRPCILYHNCFNRCVRIGELRFSSFTDYLRASKEVWGCFLAKGQF